MRRELRRIGIGVTTLIVVGSVVSGCDIAGRDPGVDMTALETSIEDATGIELEPAPPINSVPGIPSLASSRTGGVGGETVLVLEFYDEADVDLAVGDLDSVDGAVAIRSRNVVVLYTPSPTSADRSAELAELVESAPLES